MIILGSVVLAAVMMIFGFAYVISRLGMVDVVTNLSSTGVDGDQFDRRLVVHDPKVISEGKVKFATGMVMNTSAATIGSIQLDLNELDKDGNVLGSLSPTVKHLEPKATWKFKVKLTHQGAVNFAVEGISGS